MRRRGSGDKRRVLAAVTGIAMASPEILGISSASAFGVIFTLVALPGIDMALAMHGAIAGALIMVLCLTQADPLRLLLGGAAMTAICSGLTALFLASGDPRMGNVLSWLSGSTYSATGTMAFDGLVATAVLMLSVVLVLRIVVMLRWGDATAQAAGLSLLKSRALVFLLAALCATAGTILIGPLSFVGLIARHLACNLGCRRPLQELPDAALLRAGLLMLGDWLSGFYSGSKSAQHSGNNGPFA